MNLLYPRCAVGSHQQKPKHASLMFKQLLSLLLFIVFGISVAEFPARRDWTIDGVKREALVHAPANAKEKAAPVVFGFHGHGGSMQNAARSFRLHELWPEAIVVYMQGLNTPGRLTDPEGKKPGWQSRVGDQGDRDLKFFDAVLAGLKKGYALAKTSSMRHGSQTGKTRAFHG